MKKIARYFFVLIFFSLFSFQETSAELLKPNNELKPFDVVKIQLSALKNNNKPYKNAGIEQTWEFAHLINKTFTGPLERFKQMIYSDSYKILISHENHKTIILKESQNKLVYKVYVLSKDKKKYYYIWKIEKVEREGRFKDCWMTTRVSDPIYLGETI